MEDTHTRIVIFRTCAWTGPQQCNPLTLNWSAFWNRSQLQVTTIRLSKFIDIVSVFARQGALSQNWTIKTSLVRPQQKASRSVWGKIERKVDSSTKQEWLTLEQLPKSHKLPSFSTSSITCNPTQPSSTANGIGLHLKATCSQSDQAFPAANLSWSLNTHTHTFDRGTMLAGGGGWLRGRGSFVFGRGHNHAHHTYVCARLQQNFP